MPSAKCASHEKKLLALVKQGRDTRFGSQGREPATGNLPKLELNSAKKRRQLSRGSRTSLPDQTDSQAELVRQVIEEQPFDFRNIKVIIKKSGQGEVLEEVFLGRDWTYEKIPHFRTVIDAVQ